MLSRLSLFRGAGRREIAMAKSARAADNLFSELPAPLFSGLFDAARPVQLAAEQMLFLAGDAGDGCYLIEEGLLKVTVVSPTGGERILAILGAGAVVGELAMIDGAPRSSSVCAVRESALRFIGRAEFQVFGEKHPDIYRHIVSVLAKRLRDTNLVVVAASFLTLKGRVARALITLADAFGHDVGGGRVVIRQKVSQGDLAAMTGIARENVSRILNDWKRVKIVSRVASYYCLEQPAALEREAEL
jgi:CRP/FNR family cyclic AMP-dependent transcriptional regulator